MIFIKAYTADLVVQAFVFSYEDSGSDKFKPLLA